jgi:hypothetical protein
MDATPCEMPHQLDFRACRVILKIEMLFDQRLYAETGLPELLPGKDAK